MKKDFVTFNPQRDYLIQRLLRLRQDHPDTFAEAWAKSDKVWKNDDLLDLDNPDPLLFTCFAFRNWLLLAKLMPPSLDHMGRWVGGMLLVDIGRLGEPPPTLSQLMGMDIDEEDDWPPDEACDED